MTVRPDFGPEYGDEERQRLSEHAQPQAEEAEEEREIQEREREDEEVEDLDPLDPPGVGNEEVAIPVSAPPAELTGVLDSALGATERRGVSPRITGHAGVGTTYV
ncbi:MAG: hypothetical protein ACR2MP_07170, partial [Streptosporangiaceae bacterium]